MPPDLASSRRVVLLRLDNIGDVIMLTPSLRALRHALPDAELTLMASPVGALAQPLLPWIDRVLVRRALWQDAAGELAFDPQREHDFIADLRTQGFDAAIVFTSFSQTPYAAAYACYLAGIPVRAAQASGFGGGVLSHAAAPFPRDGHQVDRNLHLLASLGIPPGNRETELVIPEQADAQAVELLRTAGVDGKYIVLAPGASCAARRYDPVRYAAIAVALADGLDTPVVLLGTAQDAVHASALARLRHPRIVPLFGRAGLAQAVAVIARSALVICNNSAPMHVADAFRRPVLVLYSGTDLETQWQPRQSPARVLGRRPMCAPCYRFSCPCDMSCLDVSADDAVAAATELFAGSSPVKARVA